MDSDIEDLELNTLSLIIPGKVSFKLHEKVKVVGSDVINEIN
jgi:hypothetical protein